MEKLSGKVPNIQNILKGASGRLYGDLSEIAHFSKPRVAELLHIAERGELVGPSLLPVYTERCKAGMEMSHFVSIYFLGWMSDKLPAWYAGHDNSEAKELLAETLLVALDTGVIQIAEEPAASR